MKKLYGAALVRVSTDKQDKFGGSLHQQKNSVTKWIQAQSVYTGEEFEIIEWVEERTSGVADNIENRKGLQIIMKMIESGAIQFVVIEKLDRLSRDSAFNINFMKFAMKYKCKVFETEAGEIDMKDRGKRLGFFVKNMTSEDYSEELSEKVGKKVRSAMVLNGKTNNAIPVLGLDTIPGKPGYFSINLQEQQIVLKIFKKFAQTGSYKETIKFCEENGYKTKIYSTKEKNNSEGEFVPSRNLGGQKINGKRLKELLVNPKIRGVGFMKDKDGWNQYPEKQDSEGIVKWDYAHGPLVPEDLLKEVDYIIKNFQDGKSKQKKRTWILSGILRAMDGTAFSGEAAKSGKNLYYVNKANDMRIDATDLEAVVRKRLREYVSDARTVTQIFENSLKDNNLGLPIIDKQILEARKNVNQLELELEAFSTSIKKAVLEGQNVVEVCKILNEEKSKVESKLLKERNILENLEVKRNYIQHQFQNIKLEPYLKENLNKLERLPRPELKVILSKVFHSILVDPKDYTKIHFNVRPDPNGWTAKKRGKKPASNSGAAVRLREEWWDKQDLNL